MIEQTDAPALHAAAAVLLKLAAASAQNDLATRGGQHAAPHGMWTAKLRRLAREVEEVAHAIA